MNELHYEVILTWDAADRIFVAEVPELPGCMAHGRTRAEALAAAEAAISLWVKSARRDGAPVPPAGLVIG